MFQIQNSTFDQNCYRKRLSILNIVTMLNCMQYNTMHFTKVPDYGTFQ